MIMTGGARVAIYTHGSIVTIAEYSSLLLYLDLVHVVATFL